MLWLSVIMIIICVVVVKQSQIRQHTCALTCIINLYARDDKKKAYTIELFFLSSNKKSMYAYESICGAGLMTIKQKKTINLLEISRCGLVWRALF